MPLLSLLLIFAAVFLLFVLALVWVQWQKHTRPIAPELDDNGVMGASLAVDAPRPPLEQVMPQTAVAESPRNPIGSAATGMAPEQRSIPYGSKFSFRTQVVVAGRAEPHEGGRPASGSFGGSGAGTVSSAEPGRISFADFERRDSARFDAAQTLRREGETRNSVTMENPDAARPRFHDQETTLSREKTSARVGTQKQLHSTIDEMMPSLRVEVERSPQYQRPAHSTVNMPPTKGKANVREAVRTMPDRPGKSSLWHLFPLGRNDKPQPQQEPTIYPRMVMATPYLRTALHLCTEIQRDDAPKLEPRPEIVESSYEIDEAPRVKSEGERILVLALWWIIVPAAVIFAFYPSKSIEMHLKPEPPAEFFYQQQGWNAKRQAAEDALARAYWTCAIQSIQYQYAFNKELPVAPPPQFNVETTDPEESNSATRDRYWDNLRGVWTMPDVWEQSYVANPSWISDLLAYLQEVLRKYTTSVQKLS